MQIELYSHGTSRNLFQKPVDSPSPGLQGLLQIPASNLTGSSTNSDRHAYPVASSEARLSQTVSIHNSVSIPVSNHSHMSPHGIFPNLRYPTDDLCNRELLNQIIHDFLQHLYPLIPIIHRPTFLTSLDGNKDIQDKHFLSMLLALCAVTVGIYPGKFREYRCAPTPIRFQTRREMIDYCYSLCVQLRGPRYFDEVSHVKWAISYLFYMAYYHIGEHNKSRMIESEAILFARLLELHHVSAHSGLNLVETQLRKKAFWLMFYGYVHLQLQNHRKERLAFIDCSMLHDLDLENLLPVPLDDEQITETKYDTYDNASPALTTGFNLRSRLFWAAVADVSAKHQLNRNIIHCHCTRLKDPTSYMEHLHSRVLELKYMLDSAPWYLRQWGSRSEDDGHDGLPVQMDIRERKILNSQFATLRADIHTTHLWLQSIIMDQADALSLIPNGLSPAWPDGTHFGSKFDWFAREDICRQMLLLLCSIPESSLEANGLVLVYKVRDVAVSLFECPFKEAEQPNNVVGPATRAKKYLQDFTEKLRQLDKSETINGISLQTWVDTDRNEASKYYSW